MRNPAGTSSKGLLGGLRIIDLADEKASFCAKLLGDLGGEVIKVEKPGGEAARHRGLFASQGPHAGESLTFAYHNTCKRGITLNLAHPIGRQLLLRLIASADVVVESFDPGYLDSLGLGYQTLHTRFPGLIMASVSAFGQSGPRLHDCACDLVAAAVGGQTFVSGAASSAPLTPYGEQTHYTASLLAAVGVLLALHGQRADGQGRHIDISLQEAAVTTLDHVLVRYFHQAVVATRQGRRHWDHLFYILPCRDGAIHLTPLEHWDTIVDWLNSEGMAQDLTEDRWQAQGYRLAHVDHVIAVLTAWTRTHSVDELFELAQLMHLPWAPVQSPAAVLASPQLQARQFFLDTDRSGNSIFNGCPASPYRFSAAPAAQPTPAPSAGEHNTLVFTGQLGLSPDELADLAAEGVV